MSQLGFGTSPVFFEHETGNHPECKERLSSVLDSLEASDLKNQLTYFGAEATNPLEWINKVHLPAYVQEVNEICSRGGGCLDEAPTFAGPRSYEAARLAVSTTLTAASKILDGEIQRAFCALRPPGHHARPHKAMGFCLFNNAAVAAQFLLDHGQMQRILIVDFDVHHGNGTQEIFYENEQVFYFSSHQSPLYPGTGLAHETGSGSGRGLTRNLLFTQGSGDNEYLPRVEAELELVFKEFNPEILILSAGFDAYEKDPLGGMNLSLEGYYKLTSILNDFANQYCQGRILSVLEGGYHLEDLGKLVMVHLNALTKDS